MRRTVSSFERKVSILKPAPGTITAAGCSGYFLVKGRIPIIEAHISHWTEVAYSPEKDITLAKLTGGVTSGPSVFQQRMYLIISNIFVISLEID